MRPTTMMRMRTRMISMRTRTTTQTRMKKRKMRKKTRTGNSVAALSVLACALLISAAGKKPEPYAVVAGTVFQESGFVLPGATVTLLPQDTSKGGAKPKKLEVVSDAR